MERPSSNRFYGCSVNFATPLEKTHVVASLSSPITNNTQDPGANKHKNYRIVS